MQRKKHFFSPSLYLSAYVLPLLFFGPPLPSKARSLDFVKGIRGSGAGYAIVTLLEAFFMGNCIVSDRGETWVFYLSLERRVWEVSLRVSVLFFFVHAFMRLLSCGGT